LATCACKFFEFTPRALGTCTADLWFSAARFLYYRQKPTEGAVLALKAQHDVPAVTVIRPCKGIEPFLYECLASTFEQDYPRDKIAVHFCVASRRDPAYRVIQKVVEDHSDHNARVFVQDEDDGVSNGDEEESNYRKLLGPNPKIRNMSKAYREAGKNDLIWIVDCNVWVGHGVCARMVDTLCGLSREGDAQRRPYKLVHHLPLAVDVSHDSGLTGSSSHHTLSHSTAKTPIVGFTNLGGGRLEELFLSSSHAKMYVAINTVAVAPCIVGKSTMFRRAHLDYLTSNKTLGPDTPSSRASIGIDFFSHNICEDHLIGDLLWKSRLPASSAFPSKMRNHGLVFGDLAVQPVANMSVPSYISRRVRWLRVRKFTVPVATLVEPGTESFLCSAMGAYGLTTLQASQELAGDSWSAFWAWWALSIMGWMVVDWTVFLLLHSGRTMETAYRGRELRVPSFAKPLSSAVSVRRKFWSWLLAWLGREALALPIWTWAIWGGTTVTWRDGRYWVGLDMRVHEIKKEHDGHEMNGHAASEVKMRTE
jgi:ceramide glucosyltransferase